MQSAYLCYHNMASLFSSKFVRLLQQFDEKALRDFEKWLHSPWCNSNRNLEKLFEQLKPYHPHFSKTEPTKEELFRRVLPEGKFSESRLGNLFHEAYRAATDFLIYERFARDQAAQQDMLTRELQQLAFNEWFYDENEQEITRLESKPLPEREDHLYLFRQQKRAYHHPRTTPDIEADRAALAAMNGQLNLFYLLEKAAVIHEMILRNRLFKGENHTVQAALTAWCAMSEGIAHPAVELYRMRFEAQKTDAFAAYRQLRDTFLKRLDMLNAEDCNAHLMALLNDTMTLIRSGQLDIAESLELYQLGLEKGVLLPQGRISVATYTTIVSASNTKGSFEFTEYFMNRYTKCLETQVRPDALAWAKAHTLYWRRDLTQSLAFLQGHVFKVHHFQLIGRVLHTQTYFDLYLQKDSYHAYLISHFDAFEKWLQREPTLAEDRKKAFLRFVQCCRILADIHIGLQEYLPKLNKLLDTEPNIQALNWLRQKRTELVARKSVRH